MDNIKTVLLTGANGFVGSHILAGLIESGIFPMIMLRENAQLWRIIEFLPYCKIHYNKNGLFNLEEIYQTHSIDAIIHTATSYGRNAALSETFKTNVLLPLEIIEKAIENGVKLFINTDSYFAKSQYNQVYLSHYTESKRILEKMLPAYCDQIKIVSMRLEHVFGEQDAESKFVTHILKDLLVNKSEIYLTAGLQKRDFIYIKDVVAAYIFVLKQSKQLPQYSEFEVGTGVPLTIRDFVELMTSQIRSSSRLNFGALPLRPNDIENSCADISGLNALGWKPTYAIEDAITEMINKEKLRFE